MERNPNPNPHDRLRQNALTSWSELPIDLSKSVFKRLSFADFERAKSVCSSWYSASRQSVPKNQIPWLILFPEDNVNTCTLFNPEVKHKFYKTKDLGSEFAKSFCLATYGNWFLMRDPEYNLYILNIFTNERINLPHALSQLGDVKIERTLHNDWFLISYGQQRECEAFDIRSPLFWIDEKTKEYFVVWGLGKWCVVYTKKGDEFWKQIPKTSSCFSMAYKDHKLYFSGCRNSFRIFDFSGEVPQQCGMYRFCLDPVDCDVNDFAHAVDTKLVVTETGDVLEVFRLLLESGVWSFRVYKVCLSGSFKKYKRVDSLGDEAMLLDLGVTVLANDIEGLKKNCIYFNGSHEKKVTEICFFSGSHVKKPTEICLFDMEMQKMEALHKFDCSSLQLSRARWFLPSFMQT